MRFLSVFLATCLFLPTLFAAQFTSPSSGLVVIIHQEHLSGMSDQQAAMLPSMLKQVPPKEFGALGEVIEFFLKENLGNRSKNDIIRAFDDSREAWARQKAGTSRKIYMVKGKNAEDHEYTKKVYEQAIQENDVVDVISIVHGGRELIGIPDDMSKVRLFYTSACNGKNNSVHFMNKGVHAYVGHEATSASPLFTHAILKNWLLGKDLRTSLKDAWNEGKAILNSPAGLMLAQMLGGYQGDAEQILSESLISFVTRNEQKAKTLTINSPVPPSADNQTHELPEETIY